MANELERSKRIVFDKQYEDGISEDSLRLLEKYKTALLIKELSEKTIYNYERDLIQWLSYIQKNQFGLTIEDVSEDDIEEFIFYCKQQGNNTERLKRRMSSISAFYKYLRKKKIVKENPCEFIDRPKKGMPVVVQTFLTFEQFELMKQKLIELDDLQLYAYAMLSIDTMARVNAVSNITWEQIDLENRMINNVLEKEGYIVTLYFGEETKEILSKLANYRKENNINDNGFLFISKLDDEYRSITAGTLNSWAKKIGEMINVPTLHPHDFRHSGSQMRKLKGMDITVISSLLGHKGLDVTKNHYLREDKNQMRNKVAEFAL